MHFGDIGTIVAFILAVVKLISAVLQWWNTQETQSVIAALWAIIKNFLSIQTFAEYKKLGIRHI